MSSETSGSTVRLRRSDLVWREIEHEVVALDLTSSNYLAVNESGAVLWSALAEGASETELAKLLMDRFGLDAEQADRDVGTFLAALDAQGFLER